jgi:exopolyphosphatase / guanosine-5'-triphosphate,3'-diphosphate pyrophosphatase
MRRIAAVDMGTNSFHLIIVEVQQDGTFGLLDRQREVIRLGSHKGEDLSIISNGETEKAIDILRSFKSLADFYNAEFYSVATSAVREAQNKNEFLELVFETLGINIDVIDGRLEAAMIYKGVQKALPLADKRVLCVDIGGGSTEIVLADDGRIIFAESIKIGAVRLSKMFFPDYNLKNRAVKDCKFYIKKALSENQNIDLSQTFDIAVGTSGTINAAAALVHSKISGKKTKSINGLSFTYTDFRNTLTEVLNAKTPAERIAIPGMEVKRADIIPAGLLILRRIMKNFKIKELTISEYALREGIVLNLIEKN